MIGSYKESLKNEDLEQMIDVAKNNKLNIEVINDYLIVNRDFIDKKKQLENEKLCNVRKVFDQFNLISGLHTYFAKKNQFYKNILPPLSLLNEKDEKKLLEDLKKLDFN